MSSSTSLRIRTIWILLAVITASFILRLYWLQIVHGEQYADAGNHQYASAGGTVFDRGTIYFSEKDGRLVAAASLKSGYLLAINPAEIDDPLLAYETLSSILTLDKDDFIMRASKNTDRYEEIAHRLNEEEAAALRALNVSWTILSREKWRFYPGNSMASNVLGFVGYSGDDFSGRYGLERYYEDVLSRAKENPYKNFFTEIFSAAKEAATTGLKGDIISTIEPSVESALEHTLASINSAWRPDTTGGIIINPNDGSIYALALIPHYNPNDFSGETDTAVFSNPMVEGVYEMGSIIKPITMSIGLDTRVVTATTTYRDEGTLLVDSSRISNFDKKGRGLVTMQEVLNQSLNTGAAFVEIKVGNKKFADYMRAFGLGQETGIDLPSETHGLVDNLLSPRNIEYVTAAFGQGIALTPIETVRALSVLGNGGWLVTPHIVKSVRYESGITRSVAPEDKRRVLKAKTSEEISRMLVGVYDDALLGGSVKMEHYSIAAKTGTAQIANPEGGGYYDDRYLHSFFGYFPAYEPQFLIFLFVVHPRGAEYASETLTRPFVDLAKFLINYYDIPPDR